jgi:hypothetical protein
MLPPGNLVIRQEEELAQAAFDFATDAEAHTKIANEELSERLHAVTEEQRQFLDQKLSDHTLSEMERKQIIDEHDRELIALQAQVCVSVTHKHTQTQAHNPRTRKHTHARKHTNSHTCVKHSSRWMPRDSSCCSSSSSQHAAQRSSSKWSRTTPRSASSCARAKRARVKREAARRRSTSRLVLVH